MVCAGKSTGSKVLCFFTGFFLLTAFALVLSSIAVVACFDDAQEKMLKGESANLDDCCPDCSKPGKFYDCLYGLCALALVFTMIALVQVSVDFCCCNSKQDVAPAYGKQNPQLAPVAA